MIRAQAARPAEPGRPAARIGGRDAGHGPAVRAGTGRASLFLASLCRAAGPGRAVPRVPRAAAGGGGGGLGEEGAQRLAGDPGGEDRDPQLVEGAGGAVGLQPAGVGVDVLVGDDRGGGVHAPRGDRAGARRSLIRSG